MKKKITSKEAPLNEEGRNQKSRKQQIYNISLIIIGNLLLGFSYGALLIPKEIVSGGMSGVALIIEKLIPFPASISITILSWLFFISGLIVFGKKFASKTLLATIVLPLGTIIAENFDWFINQIINSQENWAVAIIASILGGVGIGITFRAGGSTGGFDILAAIVQKYFKIKITTVIFISDVLIMLAGISLFSLDTVLIGICVILFTTLVMDRVMFGFDTLLVQIISTRERKILDFIHNQLGRGSTIIKVTGGYLKKEYNMIQVMLNRRQFELLQDEIEGIDQDAFVSIIDARAIGLGFKEWRK